MARRYRFCTVLPVAQCVLAGAFGGWGLRERSGILSRPLFEGQTLWDSTARFHVWPWPFKFAVIENLPAFLAGVLLSWPISIVKPDLPEAVQLSPCLLLVAFLWYRIGLVLDRRWTVREKIPWIWLTVFTGAGVAGAVIPIGYTGYIPYAALVWLVTAILVQRSTRRPQSA